ncbi:MAG: polymerase, partial [Actinomycetota bacterium]|nr:polymerase [Actinomycetota bacterium]
IVLAPRRRRDEHTFVSGTASILHADLDAFYASVEQLDDPTLRGRPVIVGGLGGRGVVSAASYEARRFGVHSAMPMGRARSLCPTGAFLAPRFERYSMKSREVMGILESVTPLVEQLSIDEAFLDVSGARRLLGTGAEIAAFVRARIRSQAGLVASVGVATTKFLAKLASDLAKPNGLLTVEPGTERDFLAPLPVTRLWGVGPATLQRIERMAVHTIGELAALPESSLTAALGTSLGTRLHALATNVDPRAVVPEREAKSIGAEETYAVDLRGRPACDHELVRLVDRVSARLRRAQLGARTVTLKIRFEDFETRTRAHTIPAATDVSTVFLATARALLDELDCSRGVRLLGVSLSQLEAPGAAQGVFALDEAGASAHARVERRAAVEHAVDAVRDRFGALAGGPAAVVERTIPKTEAPATEAPKTEAIEPMSSNQESE